MREINQTTVQKVKQVKSKHEVDQAVAPKKWTLKKLQKTILYASLAGVIRVVIHLFWGGPTSLPPCASSDSLIRCPYEPAPIEGKDNVLLWLFILSSLVAVGGLIVMLSYLFRGLFDLMRRGRDRNKLIDRGKILFWASLGLTIFAALFALAMIASVK